jgi:Mg2+ and Co2+ transporter CorA
MMERHAALQDLVKKQAETLQNLNDQLRDVSKEKAELTGKGVMSDEDKQRLDALDQRISQLRNLLSMKMTMRQEYMARMHQSQPFSLIRWPPESPAIRPRPAGSGAAPSAGSGCGR